jgi:hypothetical protein
MYDLIQRMNFGVPKSPQESEGGSGIREFEGSSRRQNAMRRLEIIR